MSGRSNEPQPQSCPTSQPNGESKSPKSGIVHSDPTPGTYISVHPGIPMTEESICCREIRAENHHHQNSAVLTAWNPTPWRFKFRLWCRAAQVRLSVVLCVETLKRLFPRLSLTSPSFGCSQDVHCTAAPQQCRWGGHSTVEKCAALNGKLPDPWAKLTRSESDIHDERHVSASRTLRFHDSKSTQHSAHASECRPRSESARPGCPFDNSVLSC